MLALGGCASWLPQGSSEAPSPFNSFEAARSAIEKVIPYTTYIADLKPLGFDVEADKNVLEIPYPQLIARLLPLPYAAPEQLDQGLLDCMVAKQACRAYEFHFSKTVVDREGAFLPDFLNFRRVTHTKGWRFECVILVRQDGLVLFANYGGEPRIDLTEIRRNPLGPLQSIGESTPRLRVN